ncbi:MAG: GDP-mannose 4,6-dehydratase [Thermoanaerobaculia bacterium]|nr:GDP-mannose 4,6-dehydratase [Thermoanaerobaculia bacterium]
MPLQKPPSPEAGRSPLRILVTGATGFVGRKLAERLAAAGHRVGAVAIDQHPLPFVAERFAVDIRDAASLAAAVTRFSPDRIVHLAALSHVGESWRRIPDYFAINVLGVEHILAAADDCPVLFMSSAEVYGLVPDAEQPIAESRALSPRTPYALTKAAAERLALAAGATVVRSFNLIGAGQAPNFALPSFATQLAAIERGAPPQLSVGNLTARRDFVHIEDAVSALVRLAEQPQPGAVLNLASGVDHSIAELLERLIALSGLSVHCKEDPEKLRPVDVPRLCGDASRLRALAWEPERGVDAALEDLFAEARAHRDSALAEAGA